MSSQVRSYQASFANGFLCVSLIKLYLDRISFIPIKIEFILDRASYFNDEPCQYTYRFINFVVFEAHFEFNCTYNH